MTWTDKVTAEIGGEGVIIKKTVRTWKMPAGETPIVWVKIEERKVELEPGEDQESMIDDLDLEEIEMELQAKLDQAA